MKKTKTIIIGPTVYEAAERRYEALKRQAERIKAQMQECQRLMREYVNDRTLECERIATNAEPFQRHQLETTQDINRI